MEKIKILFEKFKNSKKAQVIAGVIFIIILLLIALVIFFAGNHDNTNSNNNVNKPNLTGDTNRVIDGVLTDASKANLLPVAIVVENYKDVRPQQGLGSANLVYEALAEGGITRFMAIFSDGENVANIGPVRSARHYFVDLAEEYGGIFAHIGGSPQALGILSFEEYVTDLNQFTYSQYYWRDENIPAPHNLFTSSELMSFAIRDLLSENPEGDYQGWKFTNEKTTTLPPTNDITINIDYSMEDYAVEWKYDANQNNYLRFNGGQEHKDANTEKQLTAKNIIIQVTETGLLEGENERLDIQTIGEGTAIIFNNGEYINGSWKKDIRGSRTLYYNQQGEEIEFVPGTTWIEIVKQDTPVNWKSSDGVENNLN